MNFYGCHTAMWWVIICYFVRNGSQPSGFKTRRELLRCVCVCSRTPTCKTHMEGRLTIYQVWPENCSHWPYGKAKASLPFLKQQKNSIATSVVVVVVPLPFYDSHYRVKTGKNKTCSARTSSMN